MERLAATHLKSSGFADWQKVWPALSTLGWHYDDSAKRAIQIRRADLIRKRGAYKYTLKATTNKNVSNVRRKVIDDVGRYRQQKRKRGESGKRQRSLSSSSASFSNSSSPSFTSSSSSSSSSSPFASSLSNLRRRTTSINNAIPKGNRSRSWSSSSSHTKEDDSAIAELLSGLSNNGSPRHSYARIDEPPPLMLASLTPKQTICREKGHILVPDDYKSLNVAVHMAIEAGINEIKLRKGVHIVETTDTDGIPIRTLQVNVPIKFVGEGIQQTVIKGGINIGGMNYSKNGVVEFRNLSFSNPDGVSKQIGFTAIV